ncbi:Filamin-A-like [Oopsacas minuta]|uniref:Filamin-A-like n=1 Tax=Oopsacas minuta TaxID=111878 RepID=A0AAV7JYG8_9METZ|nr:Filamin-A-like [Oopsacas minuta]
MANLNPDSAQGKRSRFGELPTLSTIVRETAKSGQEKDWKEIQSNTFKNWSNYIIKDQTDEVKVNDLLMDFSTGVNLVELINHLAHPRGIKDYVKKPKTEFQKLDNLYKALNFIQKDEGIKLVGIGAEDLKEGKEKPIMGLIWTLIKHYKIKKGGSEKEGGSERQALLKWANVIIDPEHVGNLKSDWNSGIPVCALVDGLAPGTIDLNRLDPNEGDANCELGITKAHEALNVPKLIAAEDMNNPKVDELSMMTYLSGFISPFDQLMLDWVNSKIANKATNLSTDWNSGARLRDLLNAHVPGFYQGFADDDEDALQGLLDKIEQEFPTNYPLSAKKMKDPNVDGLTIGCYLYKLKSQLDQIPTEDPEFMREKGELMLWVNEKIPHHKASNFNTDWNDGTRLRDLMNAHIPGFYEGFDFEGGSGGGYQQLLDKIGTKLNYICPLSGDEFSDPNVDERVVVTYLKGLRDKLRDYEISEQERLERERLARLARERLEREEALRLYEAQKADLMQWVNEMIWPLLSINNFEADWRNAEVITALLNSIRAGTVLQSYVAGNSKEKWDRALVAAENNFGVKAKSTGYEFSRDLDEREYISYVSTLLEPFNIELLQWVNFTLEARLRSKNFGENWQDGSRLAALVEATVPGFLPKDFNYQDSHQGQEVLARLHRDLANKCPYCYQEIIMGRYEPAILAAYINRFRNIQKPHDSNDLLRWVNCMIAPVQITSLTRGWSNGEVLRMLVNAIAERRTSDSLQVSSRDDMCRDAIDAGGALLGVHARNFTAHELALGNVDEFRMRQYLSEYRDKFMRKNDSTAGAARNGVEVAMEEKGIRLSEEELAALPPNDEVAKNRALISAAAERYVFNFPSDKDILQKLDTDIHITTAFLYKIKSAPERKVPTPVSPASSHTESAPVPYPSRDVEDPPVEDTKLIKPQDKSMSTRKKVQCCIITIVIIAALLIIAILVGTFIGLAVGVWRI